MRVPQHSQLGDMSSSSSREIKSRAKHVNTCSDDIGAPMTDDLMVL